MEHKEVLKTEADYSSSEPSVNQNVKKSREDLVKMRKIIKCIPSLKRIKDKVIKNEKAHLVEKLMAKCFLDVQIFFY